MKLEKAIEILEGLPGPQFTLEGKDAYLAAQLGIEALKRVKDMRISPCITDDEILPGETTD